MSPRGAALAMLTVSGVAAGHILGYAAAHPDQATREAALGGHGYLTPVASVAIPLGVLVALAWGVRTSRQLGLAGTIGFRTLAAAQLAIFAVQEVAERATAGLPVSDVLVERGVWLALVAQVGVAYAVTRAIDGVRRMVRMLAQGGRILRAQGGPRRALVPVVPRPRPAAPVAVGLRAPPVVGAR